MPRPIIRKCVDCWHRWDVDAHPAEWYQADECPMCGSEDTIGEVLVDLSFEDEMNLLMGRAA